MASLLICLVLLAACVSTETALPPASNGAPLTPELATGPAPTPSTTNHAPGVVLGTPEAAIPTGLVDILSNLSYGGIFPDKPVKLTDGTAYYDDGSSAHPFVRFNDHLIARGDLNGDGSEDAVILLENESSGTGRFVYLVPVLDIQGIPTPAKAIMVGDRIHMKSLVVDGSQVVADLIGQGQGDPACCPSWNIRKVFSFKDDTLVENSSQELKQISLEDLNGTIWRLVDLNGKQEPVLPNTEITLQIPDGKLNGFAGCNDYSGTVSSKTDRLNSIVVGPIAATKKLCSDPVMNQETTYLTRLGKAFAWWLDAGHLELTYDTGQGDPGYLEFVPADVQ